MKYLVQAILHDGNVEKVVDSFKTDDYKVTLDFLMKKHKTNYHYQYTVMQITTHEIVVNTTHNIFAW